MKKQILIVLTILASILALTSCVSKSEATPEFDYWTKIIRTNVAGQRDTIPFNDTLNVGDTVRWNVLIHGGRCYNTLSSFTVSSDTAALPVSIELDTALTNYLIEGTDLEHAKMVFKPENVYACTLWLKYIARKEGSHQLELTIANNAGVNFSPRSWLFSPVVK